MTREEDIEIAAYRYADKKGFDINIASPKATPVVQAFIEGAKWQAAIDIGGAMIDDFERLYINHTIESLERDIRMCNYVNLRLRTELKVIKYNQWISVKEQEMPMKELVLVRYNDGGMSLASRYKADDGNIYFVTSSGEREIIDDVTHWMKIPQLPRKEEV